MIKNYNMDKKVKFKADKISGIPTCLFLVSNVVEVVKACNARCKFKFPFYGLTVYLDDYKSDEWVIDKKFQKVSKNLLKYVKMHGVGYFGDIVKILKREIIDFKKYSLNLFVKLSFFSDQNLVDNFHLLINKYSYYFCLGAISFIYEHVLSEWLAESLAKRYDNPAEIITVLLKTSYKSFMMESEEMLHNIKQEKNLVRKNKLINQYIKNFFYMTASYIQAPVMDRKRVLLEAREIKKYPRFKDKIKIDKIGMKLTKDERAIIKVLKVTESIRDKRKLSNLIGLYVMDRFLDEAIARNRISRKLACRAFWFEFKDLIFQSKKILPFLRKRKYASMVYDNKRIYNLEYIAITPFEKVNKKIKTFKGTPAARGKVTGKAMVVVGHKDFKKFKNNSILVAEMTRPDFLPIMKKAKAIITDEGSLTCHAAIVSRELGIPCVVGTKIATKVLSDGDKVEVDAHNGVIKKINK